MQPFMLYMQVLGSLLKALDPAQQLLRHYESSELQSCTGTVLQPKALP